MGSVKDDLRVDDDGLLSPPVHPWAEDKYRLLALYDRLFSTGMKDKWNQRVYIDLYASAGFSKVQETGVILKGSPIIALTVPHPFDKYIFCEKDEGLLTALKARAARIAPHANITYVSGDCDAHVEKICDAIPKGSVRNRVLSLCVVDPFDFGIKFQTIRRLSQVFVDFVVLLAIGMDANRNYDHYVDGNSAKIDEALGNTEWRERWKTAKEPKRKFREFLAGEFARSMESLKYLPKSRKCMKLVRSNQKNLPLYYLALFSRHNTAYEFWDEVLDYSTDQRSFPFG